MVGLSDALVQGSGGDKGDDQAGDCAAAVICYSVTL
jgi:hypothetical protein